MHLSTHLPEVSRDFSHVRKDFSHARKVVVGIVYTFALEIIFFLVAIASVWLIWTGVAHFLKIHEAQRVFAYDPYEIKYVVLLVGGYKRRLAVKRFLRNNKIIIK